LHYLQTLFSRGIFFGPGAAAGSWGSARPRARWLWELPEPPGDGSIVEEPRDPPRRICSPSPGAGQSSDSPSANVTSPFPAAKIMLLPLLPAEFVAGPVLPLKWLQLELSARNSKLV